MRVNACHAFDYSYAHIVAQLPCLMVGHSQADLECGHVIMKLFLGPIFTKVPSEFIGQDPQDTASGQKVK